MNNDEFNHMMSFYRRDGERELLLAMRMASRMGGLSASDADHYLRKYLIRSGLAKRKQIGGDNHVDL